MENNDSGMRVKLNGQDVSDLVKNFSVQYSWGQILPPEMMDSILNLKDFVLPPGPTIHYSIIEPVDDLEDWYSRHHG